jgi:hypothetical protein
MRAILGLFVVGVGFAFGYLGYRAISAREFNLDWTRSRSSSISVPGIRVGTSESIKGTTHWKGEEAVRLGAGFIALGAMFAVWGIGIGRPPRKSGIGYWNALMITSLVCLATFVILAIPRWPRTPDSAATGCYGMILLIGLLALAQRRKLASPRILGTLFTLLIIAAFAATRLLPISSNVIIGMGIGVLSSVLVAIHLELLGKSRRDEFRTKSPTGSLPSRD